MKKLSLKNLEITSITDISNEMSDTLKGGAGTVSLIAICYSEPELTYCIEQSVQTSCKPKGSEFPCPANFTRNNPGCLDSYFEL